jgi:alpha-tubulin suppressor-like RCC1 family protein
MKKNYHHIRSFLNLMAIALVVVLYVLISLQPSIAGQSKAKAGGLHVVGVKFDDLEVALRHNWKDLLDVESWTDIVQLDAGAFHTVGLKSNGTVVTTGGPDVSSWSDIVEVAAGAFHTVGLKSDGTTVAVGCDEWIDFGQCTVESWTDIVKVAAGCRHTVGIKSDDTVVAVGSNLYGQLNVDNWSDIEQVASGWGHTVGLVSGGTVVAVGKNNCWQCNIFDWSLNFTKPKDLNCDSIVCRRLP